MSSTSLRSVATLLYPELEGLSTQELTVLCQEHSDKLKVRWNESSQTDYSIYQDPSYIFESLVSFYKVSRLCLNQFQVYMRKNNIDPKKKTYFELYNGLGINAIVLAELGMNITIHNDAAGQVEAMMKLFHHFKLKPPKIIDSSWRENKYDFVAAFEVIEHFKEPLPIVKDLIGSVKKGGCLVESTGFRVNDYPGHFNTYIIDGAEVGARQALARITKLYKEAGFLKVFNGFNCKPRVWKNVGVGNNLKTKTVAELRRGRLIGVDVCPDL